VSLLRHAANVAFATKYPIDKIVGIYSGSFNAATDTTAITYTFIGSSYKVWWYKIPHVFTRPVFCDLITSTDGDIYTNNASIAFSDSSFIYIYAGQGIAPSGTIYYKLTATWIDYYDNSNPAITPIIPGNTAFFDSRQNYQKIYLQDVVSLANNTVSTIGHDLGYKPNAKVYMECFAGQVWPCHTGGTNDIFLFADSENTGYFSMTSSNLLLSCDTNALSFGASRFWYRVYLDQ